MEHHIDREGIGIRISDRVGTAGAVIIKEMAVSALLEPRNNITIYDIKLLQL